MTASWSKMTGLLFLAALFVASMPPTAVAEEPACYECHDELAKVSFVHDPVDSGECEGCHADHGDDEELRLIAEGSALCYECHDEISEKASMHAPVDDGECTSCHNPHGSNNEMLLIAEAGALCYECHDEFAQEASMHAPVDDGECAACHAPHSSDNEKLLVSASEQLCFNCHENRGFNDPVGHAALDDGCGECHRPHSSPYPLLFTSNLTLERLAVFEETQGELCFTCHDMEVLLAPKTDETNFRHGQQNLHSFHLTGGAKPNKYGFTKKKAGQTCVACHLPHSALQDRLVRTDFECKGIFCYTMRFKENGVGGTCIVGCHKPRTLSRSAADESSTAKVTGSIGMQTLNTP